MKKLMIIEGMSCGHCVNHVKNALEEVAGVVSVAVDLQGKNAVIELRESVKDDLLKDAVMEAGYEVLDIRTLS